MSDTCGRPLHKILSSKYVYCSPDDVPPCPTGFIPDKNFGKNGIESNARWKITGKIGDFCFGDAFQRKPRYRRHCVRNSWDPVHKLSCCLGTNNNPSKCAPNWCPNNKSCDDVILKFCKDPKNFNNPICGCSLPADQYEETKLFGPPECVDKRCAGTPAAHRLDYQKNPTCNITNCVIGDFNAKASDRSNIDVSLIKQECGPRFEDVRGIQMPTGVKVRSPGGTTAVDKDYGKLKMNPLTWSLVGIAGVSIASSFLVK